jgi:hypothetical protein
MRCTVLPVTVRDPMPNVIPFLPGYIPPDVDMTKVLADVGEDGVSIPGADEAALRQVVGQARADGIDLKIVVIDVDPPIDTPLRDIATEVGQAYPESTVLALSPTFAGTYSATVDRFTLEAGQDVAKAGDPAQKASNFLGEITTDHFPWTLLTIVLVAGVAHLQPTGGHGVAAATVATRWLQVRTRRSTAPATADTPADQR